MCALLSAPLSTRIPLILRHVLQSHRVDISYKDLCRNHLATHSVVHELIAIGLHAQLIAEDLANRLYRAAVIHKKSAIRNSPYRRRRLTNKSLNQLRHRHTRGNRVGVHQHIYRDTLRRARHVVATDEHANRALLSVSVREFVSQLRNTLLDYTHLYHCVAQIVYRNGNLLHAPTRPDLRGLGSIRHITAL